MKRMAWMAVALACAASVGVVARDERTITVTGCVQNFSSTGTSGTTERGYLLSKTTMLRDSDAAMPAPGQGTTAMGTATGTSGIAAPGTPASGTWAAATGTLIVSPPRGKSSYRLDGSEAELKSHVGHRVEITGTMEPRKAGAANSETERLQVASVRLVASECSR